MEVTQWMDRNAWGIHHAVWHFSRLWEVEPKQNKFVKDNGGKREDRQEGMAGNGLDFLAMHRNMIYALRSAFPQHKNLWAGWTSVPTDPDDVNDPVPDNHTTRLFDANKAKALPILKDDLARFATDDELGLYIETMLDPAPKEPRRTKPDKSTGIHTYLHGRFKVDPTVIDPDSDVSMTNFIGNIKNQRFWRLHGWIDNVWSAYRKLKGLPDDQPSYVAALKEQHVPVSGKAMKMQHGVHVPSAREQDAIFDRLNSVK